MDALLKRIAAWQTAHPRLTQMFWGIALAPAFISVFGIILPEQNLLFVESSWRIVTVFLLLTILPWALLSSAICLLCLRMCLSRNRFNKFKSSRYAGKYTPLKIIIGVAFFAGIVWGSGYLMLPLSIDIVKGTEIAEGQCALTRQYFSGRGRHYANRIVVTEGDQTLKLKIPNQFFFELLQPGATVKQVTYKTPKVTNTCAGEYARVAYLPGTKRVLVAAYSLPTSSPAQEDSSGRVFINSDQSSRGIDVDNHQPPFDDLHVDQTPQPQGIQLSQ